VTRSYTVRTGLIVFAITLACVFVWDMTDGYANVGDALILTGVAAAIPLTWLPAFIAMAVHQHVREKRARS
jgi:hypothetical protein